MSISIQKKKRVGSGQEVDVWSRSRSRRRRGAAWTLSAKEVSYWTEGQMEEVGLFLHIGL